MNVYLLSDLSKETLSQYAIESLASEVDVREKAAVNDQNKYWDRWDVAEAMYWGDEGSSGVQMLRDVPVKIINMVKPRVQRTRRALTNTLFNVDPAVQALTDTDKINSANELEKGMASLMRRTGFKKPFRKAVTYAQLNGQAFLHPYFGPEGLRHGMVHSRDMTISPSYGCELRDVDLIGHTFWRPRWAIQQMQDQGYYLDTFSVENLLTTNGTDRHVGMSDTADPGSHDTSGSVQQLESIRLKRLIVKILVKESEGEPSVMTPFVVTFAPDSPKILRIVPYQYDRPDYTIVRLHDEHENMWYGSSAAYDLQGLQHLYTDVHNLLVYGSMVSACPPVFMSGGFLDGQLNGYSLNEIIEVDSEIKVTALPIRFDGKAMPGIIQQLERVTDAVTGQSQNANGMQLRGDATARESDRLAVFQAVNDDDYADFGGEGLEDYWGLVQMLCVKHGNRIKKQMGSNVPDAFWQVYTMDVEWDAVGKATGNSPQARDAKYAMLRKLSEDPQSEIYVPDLEKVIIEDMNLSFPTEKILGKTQKTQEAILKAGAGVTGPGLGAPSNSLPNPGMAVGQPLAPQSLPAQT